MKNDIQYFFALFSQSQWGIFCFLLETSKLWFKANTVTTPTDVLTKPHSFEYVIFKAIMKNAVVLFPFISICECVYCFLEMSTCPADALLLLSQHTTNHVLSNNIGHLHQESIFLLLTIFQCVISPALT